MPRAERPITAHADVGQWPHGVSTIPSMSIGAALAELRAEFPELTVSKLRFLEDQGLVSPQRSASGYRKYSHADVERLRFILAAQRDSYLPLKAILAQLAALDRGEADGTPVARIVPAVDGVRGDPTTVRLSTEELAVAADVDDAFVDALVDAGVVHPRQTGMFDAASMTVVKAAAALSAHGLDVRHLRMFVTAVDRQTNLIDQLTAPIRQQRATGARAEAETAARELGELCIAFHTAVLRSQINRL